MKTNRIRNEVDRLEKRIIIELRIMVTEMKDSRIPLSAKYPTKRCDAVRVITDALATIPTSVYERESSSSIRGRIGDNAPEKI
jgi:hypothetical protein